MGRSSHWGLDRASVLLSNGNRSAKPWSPSAVRGRRSELNRRIACDFRHLQPCPGPSHHGLTEQLHRDSWPGPNGDHAPEPHGRAVHCRGRQFRSPHRRRDLRSLRGKSVQEAFRGALLCQGVRKSSLPGKARGFRGQEDTVERHASLDVVMEKIVQWEQENPASNGREMIDDLRLRGSRPWRRMGDHLTKGGWRT